MNNTRSKDNNIGQDIQLIKGGRSFFMTLIICLAVFLGATGVLILAFNRLISRHDQYLSSEICTIMSEKMNSSIESMTEAADDMASMLSAQNYESPEDIYAAIKNNVKSDYLSASFIDETGEKYATEEEIAEFNKWELLKTAALADPVSMSAPYRSSVYGQPVITMFTNFEYDNGRNGYMFITYTFKELQKVAVTESLKNDVEIWLMNAESGNIIQCAGPDEHAIGNWTNAYLSMKSINEKDIPTFTAWLERIRHLENNIGITYSLDNTFYSQHCSCIKSMPGWYVVVRIPSNTLSATMHKFRNYVISFLAVLLVVVIVLIANMYRISKRDNELLERLSTHDPLTGVLNRRAFNIAAGKWILRKKDSALIFVDLDYFKQVNDQYGHNFGDKVLVTFSDALKKNFSDSSIISRFGGDEFVVITEMNSVEDITSRMRQIEKDVSDITLTKDNNEQINYSISFSSGAARFPYDADNLPLLMKMADNALYEVKERGRNGSLWYADLAVDEDDPT